jgi:hypothetical protein
LALGIGIASSACSGGAAGEEDVGIAEEAFGESTCGKATPDVANQSFVAHCGNSDTHASGGSGYDHTLCDRTWIVGYDDVPIPAVAGASWFTPPTDAGTCKRARVGYAVYKETTSGTWTDLGECVVGGVWTPTTFGGFCSLGDVKSGPCPGPFTATSAQPVKVVVEAYECNDATANTCSTHVMKRVIASVRDPGGPC